MLTQEQITSYHADGYIGVNGVFTASEVHELQRVTDEFLEQSRQFTENTDVFDLEPGHTPESPKLRRLKNPIEQHVVYQHALRHPTVVAILQQLLGEDVYAHGNKLNMKSAGYGSAVEWHQDWAFHPHTNDDLLTVGIAIDDMLLENGPLMVVPGSHKGPIYDHHQDGHFVGAISEGLPQLDTAVPIELQAGGISLHHARALHASTPNVSARPRRLLLFQYYAGDAWPLMGPLDWESFTSSFVSGHPSNEPRLSDVPVRLPVPPPVREGSIYEMQASLKNSTVGQDG